MNHLETLTAEWLEYCGYFVRKSVLAGARQNGGYEGELDVVAWHPQKEHLLHVECSLDALPWVKREKKYQAKFNCGQKYVSGIFESVDLPLDQVVILTFGGKQPNAAYRKLGGGRMITTAELIIEIITGLTGTSPLSKAVPEQYPNLRTIQLVDWSQGTVFSETSRLVR